MTDVKRSPSADEVEDSFREALENVVEFAERFKSHCNSVEELIQLAKQGLENHALLRIYLEKMATPSLNSRR